MSNYRFWLHPIRQSANEAIADQINKLGDSAFSCEAQTIIVKGVKIHGVYEVPHSLLTMVGNSEHKVNVRAFVQQDMGEIRSYRNFAIIGQKLSVSDPVKKALQDLDTIVNSKRA